MSKCAIYDFETLGTNARSAPILSAAFLKYDDDRFLSDRPYEYDELLDACLYIKFDVEEQIRKYGRRVEKATIEFWEKQGEEAKKVLKPSKSDKPLKAIWTDLVDYIGEFKSISKTFTRGNTFDPIFLQYAMEDIGESDPFPWWTIRDTRSYLDALLIGSDMDNKFVLPEWKKKFVHHDARHDIVVDTLRMQTMIRIAYGDD